MAFSTISRTYDREMAIDFSYPYDSTATGIVSKKPGHRSSKMALFGPFQPQVWAAIAIAFVSFVPTYWLSTYTTNKRTRISLDAALFQCIQCMLMQGKYFEQYSYISYKTTKCWIIPGIIWPQHYRPKYILLTWVVVTLIIVFGEHTLINATMCMFTEKPLLFQHIQGA